MPPAVLAAETPPTSLAGSRPGPPAAATASEKLAPQRQAAGSTTQMVRTRSSCKVNTGSVSIEGLIGQ